MGSHNREKRKNVKIPNIPDRFEIWQPLEQATWAYSELDKMKKRVDTIISMKVLDKSRRLSVNYYF